MRLFTRPVRLRGVSAFYGLQNVAQASFANTGSHTPSGSRTRFKSRRLWTLGNAPTPFIKLFFMPWGLGSVTGHEEVQEATSPVTIPSITVTFNGVTQNVTFSGSTSHTFANTGFGETSDALLATAFGMTYFPPGAQITIKHYYDLASTDTAPSRARGFPNWQRLVYDPANEPAGGLTTEMQGAGAFTFPTNAQNLAVFGPNIILGAPTRSVRSWFFAGDSITADGVGDSSAPGALNGGYLQRAGWQSGDAFFVHGLGGRGAYHWMQSGAYSQALLPIANASVFALGTNDISNGLTKDQHVANLKSLAVQARSAGHGVVLTSTLPPRVSVGTSGNANTLYRATDLTNQFPYYTQNAGGVGFGVGEYKDQFNSEVIAQKGANGYPDDVIDFASMVTDGTTSSKWKLPATPVNTTLAAAATALSATVSMTASPPVGAGLVFNVGIAGVEPVTGDTSAYNVLAVSGAGPYTVTIAQTDTYEGGGQVGGRTVGNALSSGAAVKNTLSSDETHPTAEGHALVQPLALTKIQAAAIVNAYESETNTLVSSFTVAPNAARIKLIDDTIKAFKDWGVWANFVALHFQGAHDSQAYKRNWKNPGTYDIVEVVAPTFTVDRGITGNGTTQYCTMGLDPSAGGTIIAQNDIHGGQFVLTAGGSTGFELGSVNGLIALRSRAGANAAVQVSCGTGFSPTTGLSLPYHLMAVRSVSGTQRVYTGGSPDGTNATASTGLPNAIQLLKTTSSFSSRQIFCTHIGNAQMSDVQLAAVAAIIKKFAVAVGAA